MSISILLFVGASYLAAAATGFIFLTSDVGAIGVPSVLPLAVLMFNTFLTSHFPFSIRNMSFCNQRQLSVPSSLIVMGFLMIPVINVSESRCQLIFVAVDIQYIQFS